MNPKEFKLKTGCSSATLLALENRGVVNPVRNNNNHRVYGIGDYIKVMDYLNNFKNHVSK